MKISLHFSCPECDKTFNCPANLASHRRWHKPQTTLPSSESETVTSSSSSSLTLNRKSTTNKQTRCSSRSDSRSTNTSSIVSDTIHENSSVSVTSSSLNTDLKKKDSLVLNGIQKKSSDQVLRAVYNASSQWMTPPLFQPFASAHMKSPLIFRHHRSLPMAIPSSFDFRRLQSSCIFCHEQFSELNHLLQHIRKTHAVTTSTSTKNTTVTLDKIVF